MEKVKCEYCDQEKKEISFCIGASNKPDWTMVEGTGKITCPDCYDKAMAEGKEAINKHCRWVKEGLCNE